MERESEWTFDEYHRMAQGDITCTAITPDSGSVEELDRREAISRQNLNDAHFRLFLDSKQSDKRRCVALTDTVINRKNISAIITMKNILQEMHTTSGT